MKKLNLIKTLLPLTTALSLTAGITTLASCTPSSKQKEDKIKKPIKLDLSIPPDRIDLNSDLIPVTVSSDKSFKIILNNFSPEHGSEQSLYYRYRYYVPGDPQPWKWSSWNDISSFSEIDFEPSTFMQIAGYNTSATDNKGKLSTNDIKRSIKIISDDPTAKVSFGGNLASLVALEDPQSATGTSLDCYDEVCDYCFDGLLEDSTALFSLSSNFIPFKNTSAYAYRKMFKGCTNLQVAPALTATTIKLMSTIMGAEIEVNDTINCGAYESMFEGCTSLQTAPYLPAAILGQDCYKNMFKGCKGLNSISLGYVGNFSNKYFSGWVDGVESLGKFYYNGLDNSKDYTYEIPKNFDIVSDQTIIDEKTCDLTLTSDNRTSKVTDKKATFRAYKEIKTSQLHMEGFIDGTSKFSMLPTFEENPKNGNDLVALIDGQGQEISTQPETTTTLQDIKNAGGTISPVYGVTPAKIDYQAFNIVANEESQITISKASNSTKLYKYDSSTGKFENTEINYKQKITLAQGEILKLAGNLGNSSSANANIKITGNVSLAGNLKTLLISNANDVKGKTIDEVSKKSEPVKDHFMAYYGLFEGSTGITQIIEQVDKDGKTIPFLPDDELSIGCYDIMFKDCTNLKTVPTDMLPATKLKADCYYGMFSGCTSLTNAPELLAETLANSYVAENTSGGVYQQMFDGCTSLVEPPSVLPAKFADQVAYAAMFRNCTSLTKAPIIKATSVGESKNQKNWSSEYNVGGGWSSTPYIGPLLEMFCGCKNLKVVTKKTSTTVEFFKCFNSTYKNSFANMFKNTVDTKLKTPTKDTVYYFEAK